MFSVSNQHQSLFENYVNLGVECIKFKLVTSPHDLAEELKENGAAATNGKAKETEFVPTLAHFKPEMTYQVFGEHEKIFGYRNLLVKLYYAAASLDIYMDMTYDEKLTTKQTGGVVPDEPLKMIAQDYETKVFNNLNEFSLAVENSSSFKPYGDLVKEFSVAAPKNVNQKPRQFVIYKADVSTPGFLAYHERMQTFLKWFIEAANYIDTDDNKWEFFVLYEKASSGYVFVGYTTVYRYYAYPLNVRPRISQFLILPPFQRQGLGYRLLETVYSTYNVKETVDINVEDAADNFQRLRDILECRLCRKLPSFAPEKLKAGWCKEMAAEAREKFKISSKQARRVYQILRLGVTDRNNAEEYRAYRIEIKQHLNAPYKKQLNDLAMIRKKKAMDEERYNTMLAQVLVPTETRIATLQNDYAILEEDFGEVLKKIDEANDE